MKQRGIILIAAITLATAASVNARADDINTAVIDVARVFEEYQLTRDLEAKFDEKRRALAEEAERRHTNIEQMRRGLAAFDPASKDFARREKDLIQEEISFEVWSTYEEKKLKAAHKAWLLHIYDKTRAVISNIAKERKIDLVLTYDKLAEDAPDSVALRQQILLQKVIYHSDRVDITDEVLDRLNKAYRDRGGAKSLGDTPADGKTAKKDDKS